MRRDLLQKHGFYACLSTFDFDYQPEEETPVPDNDMDRIFREIYQVDEETGLPKGDFAYYMSKNGNPQIKDWLVNNLLMPRSQRSGTSIEGVTDDMIAEMQRGNGESVTAYAERLAGLRDDAIKEIESLKSKSD